MKIFRHQPSGKATRVAVLSTLETNIGDEFIRDGVMTILESVWPDARFEFHVFNKHKPWTFFPKWHPIQAAALLNMACGRFWRNYANTASRHGRSLFDSADLIVQSGTPVIWPDVERTSEWSISFWRNIAPRATRSAPLLNLGGGSCYPWQAQPSALHGADRVFAQHMASTALLTTAREELASRLLSEAAGIEVPILPCPALLAGQTHVATIGDKSSFILNFMPRAGHFDKLRQVDPSLWRECFMTAVEFLEKRFELIFLCHNKVELQTAQQIWPRHRAVFPTSTREYFEVVKGSAGGLVNRLHAAVGLAGLGIPSIAIGTDTRMLMTKYIGIDTLFAPEVTGSVLVDKLQHLIRYRDDLSAELLHRRENALSAYVLLLRERLPAMHWQL